MKKGKVIFVLWMSLMLLMSGCSGDKTDTNDENNESSKRDKTGSEADNGIFGQVTEVRDDYIIIVQTERPGRSEGQKSGEEITLEDISAGDRVTVIMGDDGAADEIRVMQEGAQGQEQDTDEKETI